MCLFFSSVASRRPVCVVSTTTCLFFSSVASRRPVCVVSTTTIPHDTCPPAGHSADATCVAAVVCVWLRLSRWPPYLTTCSRMCTCPGPPTSMRRRLSNRRRVGQVKSPRPRQSLSWCADRCPRHTTASASCCCRLRFLRLRRLRLRLLLGRRWLMTMMPHARRSRTLARRP